MRPPLPAEPPGGVLLRSPRGALMFFNRSSAHYGAKSESAESPFQHFARLALLAVGDSSGISVRQIVNLQSKLRRERNTHAK